MLTVNATILYECNHVEQRILPATRVRNWEMRNGVRIAGGKCLMCQMLEKRRAAEAIADERRKAELEGILTGVKKC